MRISNNSIQTFKQCRRLWEFYYKYNLKSVQIAPALETGLTYHDKLESIIKTGDFKRDGDPKTDAMATAWKTYIYPQLNDRFEPEQWFEYQTKGGNLLVGRYDGIGQTMLLEHKSTSNKIDGCYWSALELDEQILTYMLTSGRRKVFYTVCQKPTLKRSRNETAREFAERCVTWYDNCTEQKISSQIITRNTEDLEGFEESIDLMCNEIENCTNFYRNPNHCMRWGRPCEFMAICKTYNPNMEYIGFEQREVK